MNRLLVFSFIFLSLGQTFSQKLIIPEKNEFSGGFIQYKNNEPGADPSTTCIYFDRKGFLWTGNQVGLHRFDGIDYKNYKMSYSDSTGYAGYRINDIYEDTNGNYWIGTDFALNLLNPRTGIFRHIYLDSMKINGIHEDSKAILWIITSGDIFSYNLRTFEINKYPTDINKYDPDNTTNMRRDKFLEDSKGRIWIISGGAMYLYNRSEDRFNILRHDQGNKSMNSYNFFTGITQDRSGNIWCSTLGSGLLKISVAEDCYFEKINLNVAPEFATKYDSLTSIIPDRKDRIWVFGYSTISCYDPVTSNTQNYYIPGTDQLIAGRGQINSPFRFSFVDSTDKIWFLSPQPGLMFSLQPETEQLLMYISPVWVVFDCIMDDNSSFWMGAFSGNVYRLVINDLPLQTFQLPASNYFAPPRVLRIAEDKNKHIWIALANKVLHADKPELIDTLGFIFPDKGRYANCVYNDRKGNLWFGRPYDLVTKMPADETGTKATNFHIPDYQPGLRIENIFEDLNGTYWFVSGMGLYYLQQNSSDIERFTTEYDILNESLAGNNDVLIDSHNRLWVLSNQEGVICYDMDSRTISLRSKQTGSDLPFGDIAFRISEDNEGNIWILFNMNGLYKYDYKTEKFTWQEVIDHSLRFNNL